MAAGVRTAGGPGLSASCLAGEGGLQSLLGNMSHSQLMQLIGPAGLGGLGEGLRARASLLWSWTPCRFSLVLSGTCACSGPWPPWGGGWFALGFDLGAGWARPSRAPREDPVPYFGGAWLAEVPGLGTRARGPWSPGLACLLPAPVRLVFLGHFGNTGYLYGI